MGAVELPPASPASATYRRRWWTLGILSMSLLIIGLDNTILNVAIPTLQREFSATATLLQWMVDAYILVFAGLLLLMGSLGDRYGRKRALQVGLVVFGLASFFAAFAQSSEQLIAARAVMGIGGALIMPSTLSILTHVFPREERGKAIGIWAAVAGLGIGLGPVTGGLLLEYFWWGSVFFINVPIVAVALLAGLVLVPESRDPHPRSLDILGAVLSISAVTVLVFSIIEAPVRGWTDGLVIAGFVVGAALMGAFIAWEIKTDHPMLNLDFFKNPRFSAGAGAISIGFFALFGMVFGLTQYLQFVQGFTPLEAGLRMLPVAVGMAMGAGLSHRIVGRVGSKRVVATGLVFVGGIMATIALWQPDTSYVVIGVTFFCLALSMGNVMAPSTDAVMGAVPEANAGIASAMNDVTRQVSGAFGVAVIGSVINTAYSGRMDAAVAGLPPEAAEAASDSVGAASRIASMLPDPVGAELAAAADVAFTDALGIAVLVSAGVAVAGSVLIARYLPARHLPSVTPVESEHRGADSEVGEAPTVSPS
ncbi:MAG: DHA2 family efflux MFS transporter permease subunit [Chloroflexi bacterium]|nr:DHA2 family efflux MFS transporter permease subunit [Chloroflexota bacterium]